MKKQLLTLAFVALTLSSFAGGSVALWSLTDAGAQAPRIAAESFLTYTLRFADMAAALKASPQDPKSAVSLSLPMPDGSFETFLVWETPISTGDFYTKYPGLLTYTGTLQGDPKTTVKLDVGEGAFHAMILDGSGAQYFIDPFSTANDGRYIVYDRKNLSRSGRQQMVCELEAARPVPNPADPGALTTNGLMKRTYRLALACTGEYAAAVTFPNVPTKATVLAKMVTSVNRVNGIYEKEIAATMQLIPNTDVLIFLNGTTDSFTNNNGSVMLRQNQNWVTAQIGSANYDIGHVFSTGGGGIATLGALCNNSVKAQGVTGSPSPVGDAFDVDYVAHEMGHQFGGQHTFNEDNSATPGSSCYTNGEPTTAYEPGSGSTIMAYAGLCGSNIQPNSDAYFHAISLDQTTTEMTTAPVCGTASVTGNTVPVVTQTARTYNIPWYTPFELTAPTVSGTAVTYCWEEYDLGNFGASYTNAATTGPIWRSFFPTASPTRVFPSIPTLINNRTTVIADQPSTVGRTMNFLLTVRNVANGLGAFNSATNGLVTLNAIKAADTFRILNLTSALDTLIGGSLRTVTWDVSNTAAAPINCPTVNIYYSTDSGRTWPYTLATGVPNSGSATFTVPNITTNKGRIKVKGANNVFFAINRAVLRAKFDPMSVSNVAGKETLVKVYPVPAKDVLNIVLPDGLLGVQAMLYNNMGQQIWKGTFDSAQSTFSAQNYPAGTYYFRLQNAEKNFGETVSFVIQ